MIVTIAGKPGSGKSTVGKLLAEKLGYAHYSAGDFMRQLAEERGMTILELVKLAERDKSINDAVDSRTEKLGRTKDDFVMDGHIAWKFIPKSFKIFLDVEPGVAAKRLYEQGRQKEKYASAAAALSAASARAASERRQYNAQYGVDIFNHDNYDAVIDTSRLTPEDTLKKVVTLVSASTSAVRQKAELQKF